MSPIHAKTQKAIAEALGVTRQAVGIWVKSENFPKKGPHGWDLEQVRDWRLNHQQRIRVTEDPADPPAATTEPAPLPPVPPLAESRARKEAAQAQIEETRLAKLRRELIPMDIVEREWSSILLNIRQRILDLPSKIVSQHHTGMKRSELERILQNTTADTLAELTKIPNYEDNE